MPQHYKLQPLSYNERIKSFFIEEGVAMRKLFVSLCAALTMSIVFAADTPNEQMESCQTAEQIRVNSTPEQLAQMPICCCRVANGGTCCNQQSICGGMVMGCFCTGRSVESEPLNSEGTEGKVKI